MTLKNKISSIVSLSFTVIFAVSATTIYLLFSEFRQDEFENRLKEKAISTIKLLVEVQEIDQQVLKIIDSNTINKLYNEKTLVFDAKYNLIYSSLDDAKIDWTVDDLSYLKKNKTFFKKNRDNEVYGFFYDTADRDYFALVSAYDDFGSRKLQYLFYVLLATSVAFTAISWLVTSFFVKKMLKPLDVFYKQISNINEHNMGVRIAVKTDKDEIDLLANEFNQMLHRIDSAYVQQKEFSAAASHELRTPVARAVAQIENKTLANTYGSEVTGFLNQILQELNRIAELISSLLLLSRLEAMSPVHKENIRIDELLYNVLHQLAKIHPETKVELRFGDVEDGLEVVGNQQLLEIAFLNLLKNAALYSTNKIAVIELYARDGNVVVDISNSGPTIAANEQQRIFEPFVRGTNSVQQSGMGLGLRIVWRIVHLHEGSVQYDANNGIENRFTVKLPIT